MCNFETLYLAEDGYVVGCRERRHYQVATGSLAVTITANEFLRIMQLANEACGHADAACTDDIKRFAIATPFYGVDFLFTTTELLAFHAMLEARRFRSQGPGPALCI